MDRDSSGPSNCPFRLSEKFHKEGLTIPARLPEYPTRNADVALRRPRVERRAMVEEPSNRRDPNRYLAISQVGMEMVAPIVIGLLLDNWLDCRPWLTVVGAVVGLGGGLMHLQAMAKAPKDRSNGSEGREP